MSTTHAGVIRESEQFTLHFIAGLVRLPSIIVRGLSSIVSMLRCS
ncbi:MAG TPA: hypothetical protein VEO56_14290 [Bacteroidota bacterium]|nr:hypothetical protein [Bacteroidota bacterium]